MTIIVHDWYVSPYMICMILAFIISFALSWLMLRQDIPNRIIGLSLFMNIVFIAIGGKAYTTVFSYDFRIPEIYNSKYLNVLAIPFSSMGAMFGMLISIWVFNWIYGKDKEKFWKIYALQLPLLYSVSKIGCLLMGCCHGIEYDGVLGIKYIAENDNISYGLPIETVFPVQLCETILFAVIFGCFFSYYMRNKSYSVELLCCICAVAKGILEVLREGHLRHELNSNQMFCVMVFGVAVLIYWIKKARNFNCI